MFSLLRIFLITMVLVCTKTMVFSQSDTTAKTETLTPKQKRKNNPQNKAANKAARLSAILPGAGQFYNKRYWKPPIIYIGFTAVTYFAITNNIDFNTYSSAYESRKSGNKSDEFQNIYSDDQLKLLRDDARRYRDMSIAIGIGLYAINIIDAYVDRHLMEFDVGNDLSLKMKPFLYTANYNQFASGITLNLSLKK